MAASSTTALPSLTRPLRGTAQKRRRQSIRQAEKRASAESVGTGS